jgi:hypothetical protein
MNKREKEDRDEYKEDLKVEFLGHYTFLSEQAIW